MDTHKKLLINTVDILGLGESLCEYKPNGNITFGVNDIYKKYPVDYLVCVDKKTAFSNERLDVINSSTPKQFFSQLDEWSQRKDYFKIFLQQNYPDYTCDLDNDRIPKSIYSPFVAICLAYKLFKPSEIHLYGIDMTTHKHLSDPAYKNRIIRHTRNLKLALDAKLCRLVIYGNGLLKSIE